LERERERDRESEIEWREREGQDLSEEILSLIRVAIEREEMKRNDRSLCRLN
jgi:hypothetical protein